MRIQLPSALLAAVLACAFFAAPAQAQSIRTFVSTAGSDSNPCTITQPCRHFQAAVNATAPGGEVDALDPGGYGSFIIGQAITIEGQGWSYVAPGANGNAITVNAVSGNVAIHGVSLNGAGIAGSTGGIVFSSGGGLEIADCVVRNFTGSGIAFAPTVAGASTVRLDMSNSILADNGGHGIYVQPAGSGFVTATFNRVQATNNADDGIGIYGNLSTNGSLPFPGVLAVVTDSVASGNSTGFHAFTVSGMAVVGLEVSRSVAASNTNIGLSAEGPHATLRIGQSQVTGNFTGWFPNNSGTIVSYGDNYIDDNEANDNAPTSIVRK